ncbi:hypothetical protein [Luteolibacter sp. AS25]
MKSFFFLLFTLIILLAIIGGSGTLYYLAQTSEYTRSVKAQ